MQSRWSGSKSAVMMAKCADVCVLNQAVWVFGDSDSQDDLRFTAKPRCQADEAFPESQGRLSWGVQADPRLGHSADYRHGVLAVAAKKAIQGIEENRLNLAL
jgi:hypothetical protein